MLLKTLGTLQLPGSSLTRPTPLLLLAYLALEGAKPRRYLAELFFPDAKHSLNSLSRAFSYIRQDAPGVLEADDHRAWTLLTTDTKQFETLIQQHHCTEAIALYDAPFLETFSTPLGEELEEWLFTRREHFALLMQRALLTCAETEAAAGNFTVATQFTERAYLLAEAPPIEPEVLSRYYALLQAGESSLASKVKEEASLYDITLTQSPAQVKQQLQPTFVGRKRELQCLNTLKAGEWTWVKGGIGIGKTSLLRQLAAIYLPGRSGLPYATLEPYLTDTITSGPEAILRKFYKQSGLLCIDDWENIDSESQDILIKLRNLKPDLSIVISASGAPPFAVDHLLELAPLSHEALGDVWKTTGGVPKLVKAHISGEPLAAALDATLSALPQTTRDVYLSLALLDDPDLSLVRRALLLSAQQMTQALADLLAAGLSAPSGRVWPRQLIRDYLNQHPSVLGAIATKLARELDPLIAFPLYQSSRAFWREDDMAHVRSAYMAWAQGLLSRGFPQRAADILAELPATEPCSVLQARALERAGRFKEALDHIISLETPDATALKGILFWRLGQPERAKSYALAAQHSDSLELQAEALNILGNIFRGEGKLEKAASFFKRAASLWQILGNRLQWGATLQSVAVTQIELMEPLETVEQTFEQALQIADDIASLKASILINRATAYERYGMVNQARDELTRCVNLARESGNVVAEARAWLNIAVIDHLKLIELQKADHKLTDEDKHPVRQTYKTALDKARSANDFSLLGEILANLGEFDDDHDMWDEGVRLLEASGNAAIARAFREMAEKTKLFATQFQPSGASINNGSSSHDVGRGYAKR